MQLCDSGAGAAVSSTDLPVARCGKRMSTRWLCASTPTSPLMTCRKSLRAVPIREPGSAAGSQPGHGSGHANQSAVVACRFIEPEVSTTSTRLCRTGVQPCPATQSSPSGHDSTSSLRPWSRQVTIKPPWQRSLPGTQMRSRQTSPAQTWSSPQGTLSHRVPGSRQCSSTPPAQVLSPGVQISGRQLRWSQRSPSAQSASARQATQTPALSSQRVPGPQGP